MLFDQMLERKRGEYGTKFDSSLLVHEFRPYYRTEQRIAVRYWHNGRPIPEIWTGTVGMTTGWIPVFLLMLRRDSLGSSHVLGATAKIVGTFDGRHYRKPDGTILRLRRSPDTSIGAWLEV